MYACRGKAKNCILLTGTFLTASTQGLAHSRSCVWLFYWIEVNWIELQYRRLIIKNAEEINCVTNRHTKMCSSPLFSRDMHFENTVTFYYPLTRMAEIKWSIWKQKVLEKTRYKQSSSTTGENGNWYSCFRKLSVMTTKLNIGISYDTATLFLHICPVETLYKFIKRHIQVSMQ